MGWGLASERKAILANPDKVLSFEGDWRIGDGTDPVERHIFSTILFGPSRRVSQARAKAFRTWCPSATAVDMGDDCPIETSPAHSRNPETYFAHEGGVAVDLWHVREMGLSVAAARDFTKELVDRGMLRSIDFQTRDLEELDRFLNGDETELGTLLAIAAASKVNVSIELNPTMFLSRDRTQTLKKLGDKIREYF